MKKFFFFVFVSIVTLTLHAKDLQNNLSWVQNWGYWLQNANIDIIDQSPYDLVVIDYSRDGTEATRFDKAEIEKLHQRGKLVLAYFSIGEAEDYRFYWKSWWKEGKPAFVGAENPDWPGNYKVKYWYKGWWNKALQPYLDKIIADGYDGVYLDIIDAYWYWGEQTNNIRKMANKMAALVTKISTYGAEHTTDGFIVTAQNGLGILDDMSARKVSDYLAHIDAVGIESLFYNAYSSEDQAYRMEMLKQVQTAGKKIFNVEYITPSEYDTYWQKLDNAEVRMVGYCAEEDQALDELTHFDW